MGYYGSTPKTPEIEIGSEFVSLPGKHHATARILRDETDAHGTRTITLDRLLDRYAGKYNERIGGIHDVRKWTAKGAFVTELTTQVNASADASDESEDE